ncbi:MAG: flagellar hook-basal body protein [Defluviitaleaceae bacterium]|nr:flagellar hook-basal body protein [Defluviitaleaceae bacterium]
MMRSLWTAASGMTAQQFFVDSISHNLSNVNTTGFKQGRVEFQSLMYQTMRRADLDPANMTGRPVNLQVGLGVTPVAVSKIFTQGNLQRTDNMLDFAIEGDGFFAVRRNADPEEIFFTRDGSFKLSPLEAGGLMLATSLGYPVLDVNGDPIIFDEEVSWHNVTMSDSGAFFNINADGDMEALDFTLQIVQFPNPQGLEAIGANLFMQTPASGAALLEAEEDVNRPSRVFQGFLEMSNVDVAREMVDMIRAHRAYDLNARAITTSDEMLQQANQLKR